MTNGQFRQFTAGGVFQCQCDAELTVVFANSNFYSFIGYSPEEFLSLHSNKLQSLGCCKSSLAVSEYIQSQLQIDKGFSIDVNITTGEGVNKWMWINADLIQDPTGSKYLYCIFSDITTQKSEQEQLKTIQQRYQFVLNHIEDIIFEWNYITKEMYQMGGQDTAFNYKPTVKNFPDDLILEGRNIHPDDREIFLGNYRKYESGAQSAYAEYRIRGKNGIYFWCSTSSVGVFENGELVKVMGRVSNINDQKMQLLEMSRKALRDPLTELYNRKATESLVEQYIDSTENMAAMMIIDLDNFKLVNDTLGHLQGDNVLNEIAAEIKSVFRDTDIVGRVGGDEFVVFLTDLHNEDAVYRAAKNILVQFQKTLENFDVGQKLSGSVGISFYPKDAKIYSDLIDKADIALYCAKNTGKNKYVVYDPELTREGGCVDNSAKARVKRTPNESQKREDLYKLALEKSGMSAWVYDVKNKRVQRLLTPSHYEDSHISHENFPQDIIDKGYVHTDSVVPLLDMYKRLAVGQSFVSAEICTLNPKNSAWDWDLISYTSILGDNGEPDLALGTAKDITEQKNAQIKYKHEADMFTVLDNGILCASITNLTKNVVERYRHCENESLTESDMTGYDDVIAAELAFIANPDDIKRYRLITREHLMSSFEKGESNLWLELRRTTAEGRLMWVSISFSLLKDAQRGDIYVYSVMRDIDSQKRQELSLTTRAQTDDLTGAYEQQTARELMGNGIQRCHTSEISFALINFNVDKYSKIVSCDGEKSAQAILLELSRLIQFGFTGQLMGRFFGNQLLVFVQDIPSQEKIVTTVNEIRKSIENNPTFSAYSSNVTISVGVAFDHESIVDFSGAYRYAEIALDAAKKSGCGECVVYTSQMTPLSAAPHIEKPDAKDIILRCALVLTELDDKAKGLTAVLNEIGVYYGAYRVFISELSQDASHYTTLSYAWATANTKIVTNPTENSLQTLCPYLSNCLEKSNVVIINDISVLKDSYPQDYKSLSEKGVTSLLAAIVKSGDAPIGFITVINPTMNVADTLFFTTMHRFLSSEIEKRRMYEKRKFLSLHDSLTSLFNRNKYAEYASTLKEESLISLGTVSVDINGLKQLNSRDGHKVGDLAVISTAAFIQEVFVGFDCYRFSGDEFLTVCENISRHAFIEKVLALKTRCGEFVNFSVSIGYAWSDMDIRLEDLVRHSDEKMMNEKQDYYLQNNSKTKNYNPEDRIKLIDDIAAGRYVMFLQPKISAETNSISGAEALVRFIDEEGVITYPDKFIPQYEANGLIKYIDLLMMENVCRTIRSWLDLEYIPISISLNLSRATILAGNIVAELCHIADIYKIPKFLIEIEITESFGDLERETIASVGNQISSAGFKLSLDDFGAKYSNLSILSAASWNTLKIDKSLVNDIFSNQSTQIILKKLFETCKELGISAIAEGVETMEQQKLLLLLGCNDLQGYYFNKPMMLKNFEREYLK